MSGSEDLVRLCLERIRERVRSNIVEKGLRASGRTEASMRVETSQTGGKLYGRADFADLERGSGPGYRGSGFREVIRQWVIDKGLSVAVSEGQNYEVALRKTAGAIAHSIQEYGTRTWRDGGRRDIYSEVIYEEVRELKQKITAEVVRSISAILPR